MRIKQTIQYPFSRLLYILKLTTLRINSQTPTTTKLIIIISKLNNKKLLNFTCYLQTHKQKYSSTLGINKMITFTQLLACNGSVLYETTKSQMTFITSGKLSLMIAYDGMVLMQLNNFQYGINPSMEIVYDDTDPQFCYIFYLQKYPEGHWVLKVNENADEVFSCLNEKCYLKNKNNSQKQKMVNASNQTTVGRGKKVNLQEQVKVGNAKKDNKNSSQQKQQTSAKSVLIGASKQLSKGLSFTGKFLSKGFQNFGGYISKKVQPTKKVEVSQSTKQNINLAKKTTNNVLTFTAEQVGALFKFGKTLVVDAGQTFQKSEKGKQLQEKQYYGTVKEGAKTGATVVANVYDGVVNAIYEIGSGASKGVTKVVGAKYGQDAEQATDGMFQGVGNVAKLVRVPKDQAAKAFKQ